MTPIVPFDIFMKNKSLGGFIVIIFHWLLMVTPTLIFAHASAIRLASGLEPTPSGHGAPPLTFMAKRPDTKMFWQHKLVPVTSILPSPWVQWSPVLLSDLASRDIRRQGGHKKAAQALEAHDDDTDAAWHREVEDGAMIRARASWREQKWSRGEALDLGGRKTEGARTTRERLTHHAPRRAFRPVTGDGLVTTLFSGHDEPLHGARPFLDDDRRVPLIVRAV